MSREAVYRMALVAIRRLSTEASVHDLVDEALEGGGTPSPSGPKSGAQRSADYRRRRAERHDGVTDPVTGVTEDVTPRDVTRDVIRDVTTPLSSSPPLSLSGSSKTSESESVGTRTGVTLRHVTPSRHASRVTRDGERYVRIGDQLTDELRAIAQQATVQDIEGAWLKFVGYHADQWTHVNGAWQHWCVNERNRERVDRERSRERASGGAGVRRGPSDENYSPPPVSHRDAGYCRADCDRMGVDPEVHGIARDAPPLGNAKTHPAKRAG